MVRNLLLASFLLLCGLTYAAPALSAQNDTICQYSSITLTAPGSGIWSALATNPSATIIDSPLVSTTVITGFDSVGIYGFVWLTGSTRDTFYVSTKLRPDAGPDQSICQYSLITLSDTSVGIWYAFSANPANTSIAAGTASITQVSGFTLPGTYFFGRIVNGCADTVAVIVTAKPNAGLDQSLVCFQTDSATITAVTPGGVWSAAANNPGSSVIKHPNSISTVVDSFGQPGYYNYVWTVNGCTDTVQVHAGSQVNDNCSGAISMGTLPSPPQCGSGIVTGSAVSLTGDNLCASPEAPFPYQLACPVNLSSPPKDVWYSFVASSATATITVSSGAFTPVVSVWGGSCGSLVGIGCGTGATVTVYQLNAGSTYYVQISGQDSAASGSFNISIQASTDCDACLVTSNISSTPPPVNGTYYPGETVTFCYNITSWNETSANWLHGVTFTIGSGWDPASLILGTPPPSQSNDGGFWAYYPAGQTSSFTGNYFGPGYYYETASGTTGTGIDTDPGNNFGDNAPGTWSFCITLTAIQDTGCNSSGENLNIGFQTSGDGESGSWSSLACQNDPTVTQYNVGACCPPTLSTTPASCGHNDGTATAIPSGSHGPWRLQWSNGTVQTNVTGPSTIYGLFAGNITVTVTDIFNCQSTSTDSVKAVSRPNGGGTKYISCPSVDTVQMTGVGHGIFSIIPGNPAPTAIVSPDSANTVIRGFTAVGDYFYQYTLGSCSDTVEVIVSNRPNAGPDISTCLNGTVTMQATGTGTWAPLPGNSSATVIVNPTNPNTVITGFTVPGGIYGFVWNFSTCADTAFVFIPSFTAVATALDSVLCRNQRTTLMDSASPAALGPFTYSWSPVAAVVSPTSPVTQIYPLLNPTTFYVTVTSAGGCVLIDSVPIQMQGAAPIVHIVPSNNNVCPGDTIQLNGSVQAVSLVPCGPTANCPGNSTSLETFATIDTATHPALNTQNYSPFEGDNNSHKVQYLFRASELNAAGLSSGIITDLAFYVYQTQSGGIPYDSFTVSLACTNADSLTGYITSGLTEVFYGDVGNGFAPAVNTGLNSIPFINNLYGWDGVSNIVVQICYTINPNIFSGTDFVTFGTTSYNSTVHAQGFSGNGCNLTAVALNKQRPDIRFGMCIPNTLSYTWTPATLICDSCLTTAVVVTQDTTYTLTVNDNGCPNDTSVNLRINRNLALTMTGDTTLCSFDTVQLNVALTNQPAFYCHQDYTVASIPYSPLSTAAPFIIPSTSYAGVNGTNNTSDGTAGPFSIGFHFPFYCESYDSFYVNTNGWISLVNPYPAATAAIQRTAQALPPTAANLNPEKLIAFVWGNFNVAPAGGGTIDYFVSGTGSNAILVVQFNNILGNNGTTSATGELHIYPTGVIDILIQSDNFSTVAHTTGIKDSTGLGVAAPGRNDQTYAVNTPEAWRFTPDRGYPASINSAVWSPNRYINDTTIPNPLVYPPATQTYQVAANVTINYPANPEVCIVHDSVTVRIGTAFASSLTALRDTICPHDSVQLTVTPAGAGYTYVWNPTTGLSSTTIDTPYFTPSANGADTLNLTVYNASGCHTSDVLIVHTYMPLHPSIGHDSTVCAGNFVTLSTPGTYSSYHWYNIDSATGITHLEDSAAVFAAYPDSLYYLKVTALGATCPYYSDTVQIKSYPHQVITVLSSGSDTFCQGSSVTLQASLNADTNTIVWTPANHSSTRVGYAVDSSGLYSYTAEDLHGCTVHSDTAHISVTPEAVVTVSESVPVICTPGGTSTLTATVVPAGTGIYWTNSAGTHLVTSNTYTATTPDVYTAHTVSGCADSASVSLVGSPAPSVNPVPIAQPICNCSPGDAGQPVSANVAAPNTDANNRYVWIDLTHNDTLTSASIVDTFVGTTTYNLTITDSAGCTASFATPFTVDIHCAQVKVNSVPRDTLFRNGDSIMLIATSPPSSGTLSYQWGPDSVVSSPTSDSTYVHAYTPAMSGSDSDVFFVKVFDGQCTDSVAYVVYVIDSGNFVMATAFTPNGDGINDYFYPVLNGGTNSPAHVTELRIFNRWGQLVYNNPSPPGWDGNFTGSPQVSDTYIYFITVQYPDPANPARTISKSVTGSFQLFR